MDMFYLQVNVFYITVTALSIPFFKQIFSSFVTRYYVVYNVYNDDSAIFLRCLHFLQRYSF
jgi:hypothetical protein